MTLEPRQRDDYGARQIQAAHRVLVDLGQVLASFKDRLVVVGGWTPDLQLPPSSGAFAGVDAENTLFDLMVDLGGSEVTSDTCSVLDAGLTHAFADMMHSGAGEPPRRPARPRAVGR